MDAHEGVKLRGICEHGDVEFPEIAIADGDYGFFPYRMKLGGAVLSSALAAPLCRLETKSGDTYVFYGDRDPMFRWEGEERADVLHLSRKDALLACRVKLGYDYLILAEDFVWEQDGRMIVIGGSRTAIRSFPELPKEALEGFVRTGQDGRFTLYERRRQERGVRVETVLRSRNEERAVYEIAVSYGEGEKPDTGKNPLYDVLLHLEYEGNRMDLYDGEKKINDYFYTGEEELLSLRYFDFPGKLKAVVHTLCEDTPVFLEKRPDFGKGPVCSLKSVRAQETFG